MKIVDDLREKPLVQKLEKFFPAIAFLAGFAWDSLTLGTKVYGSDLLILFAYYVGAFILVLLLSAKLSHPEGWTKERVQALAAENVQKNQAKKQTHLAETASKIAKNLGMETNDVPENAIVVKHRFLDREWSDTWKSRFTFVLQFLFGGLFSALVVCYFKSSGSLASFILVICLAALLVGNEFLKKHYESFSLTLAFFCLLGTMFLNFTLPHVVHRIGFFWFLLSSIISFLICIAIWKISHREARVMIAPSIITIFLIIAYLMNWVPPVPLVLKNKMACQNFDKKEYSCEVDKPNILQRLGLQNTKVYHKKNAELFVLSSVYAPADLKANIEYRWYFKAPNASEFQLTDKISSGRMIVKGGREEGFRSFSKKKNVKEGSYRVETAFKDGAVIGSIAFKVIDEERDSTKYIREFFK